MCPNSEIESGVEKQSFSACMLLSRKQQRLKQASLMPFGLKCIKKAHNHFY
jgi:hypothetical protein